MGVLNFYEIPSMKGFRKNIFKNRKKIIKAIVGIKFCRIFAPHLNAMHDK